MKYSEIVGVHLLDPMCECVTVVETGIGTAGRPGTGGVPGNSGSDDGRILSEPDKIASTSGDECAVDRVFSSGNGTAGVVGNVRGGDATVTGRD